MMWWNSAYTMFCGGFKVGEQFLFIPLPLIHHMVVHFTSTRLESNQFVYWKHPKSMIPECWYCVTLKLLLDSSGMVHISDSKPLFTLISFDLCDDQIMLQ